ncbi:hypothetical protein EVAR_35626_1 [Eumeta japonica]|uniref:Uncharacterized protein n=1 Tax=Eumeta variegata TaxID=151549 RepID=A0A4C1WFT3_EUMVA|nr:hypothetical protein EVAR_35626_1 [Eumeta japonica]
MGLSANRVQAKRMHSLDAGAALRNLLRLARTHNKSKVQTVQDSRGMSARRAGERRRPPAPAQHPLDSRSLFISTSLG